MKYKESINKEELESVNFKVKMVGINCADLLEKDLDKFKRDIRYNIVRVLTVSFIKFNIKGTPELQENALLFLVKFWEYGDIVKDFCEAKDEDIVEVTK